ncbi:Rieske Fe-S protein [Xenococcus sp. PCC 7305]|uniref:QcrA and Rieske domain-containing protein n=1 Tax=Xenococcus sp. PCC 7305 TaxID=102125 RepID=UPI0002AB99ED|nr:Rieske 2Fe-2S domain-containing protein [Xenococcus sp. PCC 7305]ELS00650.1 Rieske Fe-S protein [Xenococcus sp. PCC 7305]
MERRKFLSWVGVGMLASSLPVAIAACSSETSSSSPAETSSSATPEIDTTPDAEGFTAVGTNTELTTKGFIYDKQLGVIIVSNGGSIAALNPTCSHQGCDVDWKGNTGELVCPCHGSKFGVDGAVLTGPATEALPVYEFKQEGDLIKVKIA